MERSICSWIELERFSVLAKGVAQMQFNFFQWIREGVRQSVLLGVSDAMNQIGTPEQGGELHEELQRSLGTIKSPPRPTGRKRLGKSLKELEAKAVK